MAEVCLDWWFPKTEKQTVRVSMAHQGEEEVTVGIEEIKTHRTSSVLNAEPSAISGVEIHPQCERPEL